MIKKTFIIILLLVLTLAVSSCSNSEFSYYESFYEDMDIAVRMEDYLRKADDGDVSKFYFDELKTMKEDLSYIPEECHEDAHEVNDNYIAATDMLISCYLCNKTGEKEKAQQCLETAWMCFNNGNMRYNDFVVDYLS